MENNLRKLDKYLGKRVKVTEYSGKSFFFNVRGCGTYKGNDYISGFDDERINQRVFTDALFMIQEVEEPKIKRFRR